MSDFKEQISGVSHSKYANAALYTLFFGMALGNLLPSPSDALYMHIQTKLRDKWKRGEITPEQYWKKNALAYYFVPFTWWALLGLIVINVKGTSEKKAKIALALLGSSVVMGVILKQIQKDKKELSKEDEAKLKLLKDHPEVVKILSDPKYDSINGQFVQFKNVTAEKQRKELEELKAKNKSNG